MFSNDDDDEFPPFDFDDQYELIGATQEAPQGIARETAVQSAAISERVLPANDNGKTVAENDHEKVVNAFGQLMERATTEEEKARLLKLQYELNIKPSDSLWVLLLQFESYNSLFNAVPARVSDVVESCIEKIQKATNEEIKRVNIGIQRRERELDHDIDKASFELSHKINELIDKLYDDQKVAIEKEVQRRYDLRKWTILGVVALMQMVVIISTNAVIYFLATGNTLLPWFEPGQGSTVSSWVFQALWNMPSGWVMSCLIIFGGIFYIWYDNFKKL